MSDGGRLDGRGLAALFLIGAVGGLVGDMCHIQSGTTVYLEDPLPYIWESQLWFPLMVGGGTAALGWIGLRLGARASERERAEPWREGVAMVAAVIGLYALTALVRGEPGSTGIVLCWAVAVLIVARFAHDRADLVCSGLAVVFGTGIEILLGAADVAKYADDIEEILGVAAWLPALYLAFGVVASRLGVLLSR